MMAMNEKVHDSDWCVLDLSGFEEEVCGVNVGAFLCARVCVRDTVVRKRVMILQVVLSPAHAPEYSNPVMQKKNSALK